ncbi:MAG: NAD-dependent epimerase/dehydratase family protein [Planctomycetota bacterium]
MRSCTRPCTTTAASCRRAGRRVRPTCARTCSPDSSLIEFALQARVPRFLLVSTLEVYGARATAPLAPRDETAPLWPDSLYGMVKYALELAGLACGDELGFQVVRPGWVFGAHAERASHCWQPIVARLLAGDDVPVQAGAFMIWVEDLARLVAELQSRPLGPERVFNAHSGFLDWHRVTEIGKQLLGSRSRITGSTAPPPRCPIVADRILELGVALRVEEGVRRTLEHIAAI